MTQSPSKRLLTETSGASKWQSAKSYVARDNRVNPYGQSMSALADHTAANAYDARNWRAVAPGATPSLTALEASAQPLKQVLYQNGATIYATDQATTGQVFKSTDSGNTWTAKGSVGWLVKNMVKLGTTGTLLCVEYVATSPAGLNPRIGRSTDDGATWTNLTGVINFPTLGSQSMIETPSGYALICEYGNVGNTVYRILRSTDDGATWTAVKSSSGTDPSSDPGHWHSITYDAVASCFVAFHDRSSPDIYKSTDEGATWQLIGSATGGSPIKPNFVAPMFFANYVAWAYDTGTPSAGCIARIKRADFYDSSKWDADHIEVVAALNPKSAYFTYPIADDAWLQSFQSTSITPGTDGIGGNSQEIYLVSGDGAVVSGGIEQVSAVALPGTAKNDVITFPTYPRGMTDGLGTAWLNFASSSLPRNYTAVPVGYGVRVPMPRLLGGAPPVHDMALPNGIGFRARDTSNVLTGQLIVFDANNRLIIKNPYAAVTPELRMYETSTGLAAVLIGGTSIMGWSPEGTFAQSKPLYLGGTSSTPSLNWGNGSPEGVVAAVHGSIYLNFGAGQTVWMKHALSGNVGWVPINADNPVTAKTATYTMLRQDTLIVMTAAGATTVHLADPTGLDAPSGRVVTVKNAGAGTVTVDSLGTSKTIDGAASISLAQWGVARLVSDGAQWLTI